MQLCYNAWILCIDWQWKAPIKKTPCQPHINGRIEFSRLIVWHEHTQIHKLSLIWSKVRGRIHVNLHNFQKSLKQVNPSITGLVLRLSQVWLFLEAHISGWGEEEEILQINICLQYFYQFNKGKICNNITFFIVYS